MRSPVQHAAFCLLACAGPFAPMSGVFAAAAPPELVSGSIYGATVTVGTFTDSPSVKFTFTAPGILVGWTFTFTAPHGATYNLSGATVQFTSGFPGYLPPAGTSGTVEYTNRGAPLSLYAEAGTWTLTGASLEDAAGNTTTYDAAQLAKLFPSLSLTVNNSGKQDFVAPVVSAGKLLSHTVSLGSVFPYLGAAVSVTDNLSGAVSGTLLLVMPNGQPYSGPDSFGTYGPAPVTKGQFQFGNSIAAGSPTGTWTISGYQVCDYANNCLIDTTAADVQKLFGTTTFTVTN